ncbi:RagB/SusD family nutrient uptake outer membrane protein [Emticicia sp. TH156]|uniref:RagB/SusD family nutrient uptake outer membrane protein n=1 Tax=Emticicia sp. TH156 TaxID=2067454 RepID=UPI000C76AF1C|nr:RagB/SusD family nutrient uptake outer membrane protein [Emticicia sp. TH156]PLK46211.1 RagB/SusD family nutrient uptake outer membrane protein [Emticicia sp. TH156]
MKRFNHKIVVLGILITSFLSSCKDSFLELSPYTQIPNEAAVATEADMLVALRGAYSQIRSANLYGRTIPVIGDLGADNVFLSSRNSGRYFAFDQYIITTNNADYEGFWNNAYTGILRANNIINSKLADNANVLQLKGEAYALRALLYFNLLRSFSQSTDGSKEGVPLVLSYNPTLKPSRNTVQEVYAQIQADLDKAYTSMTVNNGSARFSKYAARALAAKVALYQADYEKALTYATDVITNGGFTLLTASGVASYWANPASNASTVKTETLFEVSADAVLNVGTDELGYIYNQAGYGDLLANEELYKLYADTDVRKKLIVIGSRAQAENPAYIVNKYQNVAGDRDDKKVLRMSEVYLIAAEAAARTNKEADALKYLNTLVAQRDSALVYSSSGATLIENIITERRKELAFEGDRFYDLNRLKRDIVRVGGRYSVRSIPFSSNFRIGPIPQSERNANPNISQNAGY